MQRNRTRTRMENCLRSLVRSCTNSISLLLHTVILDEVKNASGIRGGERDGQFCAHRLRGDVFIMGLQIWDLICMRASRSKIQRSVGNWRLGEYNTLMTSSMSDTVILTWKVLVFHFSHLTCWFLMSDMVPFHIWHGDFSRLTLWFEKWGWFAHRGVEATSVIIEPFLLEKMMLQ